MKKFIFSLLAFCALSTFAFANNDLKTTDNKKVEKVVVENKKIVLKEEITLKSSQIPWECIVNQVTWYSYLVNEEGFSHEDAVEWSSSISSMCYSGVGTTTWP